jgi:hypothetical protein
VQRAGQPKKNSRSSALILCEKAEAKTGVTHQQVSRWRTRLKRPDYRQRLSTSFGQPLCSGEACYALRIVARHTSPGAGKAVEKVSTHRIRQAATDVVAARGSADLGFPAERALAASF